MAQTWTPCEGLFTNYLMTALKNSLALFSQENVHLSVAHLDI